MCECMHLIYGYLCIVGLVFVKHVYLGLFLEPMLKAGEPCNGHDLFCGNHLYCDRCVPEFSAPVICISGNHSMQLDYNVCVVDRV